MKRIILMLLCMMLLLTSCATSDEPTTEATENEAVTQTEETETPEETIEEEPITEETPIEDNENDTIAAIKSNLIEDFSFSISYQYMNLTVNGISQELTQEFAQDGSFHSVTTRRQWMHAANYDVTTKMEYYYRYEGEELVCYMRADDGAPEMVTVSPTTETEMEISKIMIVGPNAILPTYLENFTELGENAETGTYGYSFTLPIEQVLESNSMLASFITNSYMLYGSMYDYTSEINIICNLEVDKDTLRPAKLTYDFTELKPYILSDGALSGEYALDTDLMYMTYEFDYDLAETIDVPEEFIP